MRAAGKRSARAVTASISCVAGEDAAFEFEIVEAVAGLGGFGEMDDGFGGEGLLVAETQPVVGGCVATVGEIGLAAVADVEEVAEHFDAGALLAVAEEGCDGDAEKLAEKIEQGGLRWR